MLIIDLQWFFFSMFIIMFVVWLLKMKKKPEGDYDFTPALRMATWLVSLFFFLALWGLKFWF